MPFPAMSGGTVHRLEHARESAVGVDVARGREADAAADRAGQVREDVAEEVVRDDDVESSRIRDEEDGRGVDVEVVDRDIRELGATASTWRFQSEPANTSTLVLCTSVSFFFGRADAAANA